MVQTMPATSNKKKTLFLIYSCYLCEDDEEAPRYPKAARLIMHVRDQHGFLLPSRQPGIKRPANREYMYQSNLERNWDEQQYACPSCWFHTDDMDKLTQHMTDIHDPPPCEPQLKLNSYTRGRGSRTSRSISNVFVYDGKRYEKQTVNVIFKQIQDLTVKFKDMLRMD